MTLDIGNSLADLHHGWQKVKADYDLAYICEFDFRNDMSGGSAHAWVYWLNTLGRMYVNKTLVVVATEPELIAGWCYDGRHGGLVTLRPKRP